MQLIDHEFTLVSNFTITDFRTFCELPRLIVPFSNSFKLFIMDYYRHILWYVQNLELENSIKNPKTVFNCGCYYFIALLVVYFIELQQKIFLSSAM